MDADANANLNEVLGVEPEVTLGELREEIERAGVDPRYQIPSGMSAMIPSGEVSISS